MKQNLMGMWCNGSIRALEARGHGSNPAFPNSKVEFIKLHFYIFVI